MTNTAIARTPSRRAGLRRSTSAIVLGLALATAGHGAAFAAPEAEIQLPPPEVTPPPIGQAELEKRTPDATGSLDAAPATDNAPTAAAPVSAPESTPAPVAQPTVAPAAPTPAQTPIEAMRSAGPVPAAIADALTATGLAAPVRMTPADRATLTAFYTARQGAPLWIENGRFSAKADAAKARIAAAADDALNVSHFKLPDAPASPDDAAASAKAELQLTLAALTYAREAWGGQIAPSVVSPSISAKADPFDANAALVALADDDHVAATLDGFNPQHDQFKALKKLLVAARGTKRAEDERPQIGYGALLQPGDEDARVPLLRARLGLKGDADDLFYDPALVDAVTAFQKSAKIGASGMVNRQTVRALNAGAKPKDDSSLIALNMERWRWMPRDLGAKHVFVDLAAFQLHVMQDGRSTYDTRVIIGKATNQTPLLSSAINQIVVNPYWNVPVSIAMKELSQGSLRGFEVVDSRGKVVNAIDWEAVRAGKMRIRQAPGERNALGHIKFLFPNSHAVYLHDTPKRDLFVRADRAMSHGCVRVDQPLAFADALSGDQGWDGDRLKSMVGGKERGIPLSTTIPVHLAYFTAWVNEDGTLSRRNDLYSLDQRLGMALRGEPLPPLPSEDLPSVASLVKPKPAPRQEAAVVPPPQTTQQRGGPAAWLARIFGDSRY